MTSLTETYQTVLSRLKKVTPKRGYSALACCPAHDDQSPSLSVMLTTERVLLHCKAGCSFDAITRALGIDKRAFFAETEPVSASHPPTSQNPHATAAAYLRKRGIKTENFPFTQTNVLRNGERYHAVQFELSNSTATIARLIDYTGKDKYHFSGKFSGSVWTAGSIDAARELWVTEGIIDAMSLTQVGKQAVACLSSSALPTDWYKTAIRKSQRIILAFDNDDAGHRAIKIHSDFFKELGFGFAVALPPRRADWNSLLVQGRLTDEMIADSLYRGELFSADTIEQFYDVFSRKNANCPEGVYVGLLEWGGRYYWVTDRVRRDKGEKVFDGVEIEKISDFTLELLFSIKTEAVELEPIVRNVFEIVTDDGKKTRVAMDGAELVCLAEFKKRVSTAARAAFDGSQACLAALMMQAKRGRPIVRSLPSMGYDKTSNSYVFGGFLYDQYGNRKAANEYGFFNEEGCFYRRSSNDVVIDDIEQMDIGRFLSLLVRVYGEKSLLILGYYIATVFSQVVHKQERAFPFLSVYGQPQTGKTTLINALNQCFFLDWAGLSASHKNTTASILRSLSQKSALVVPYNENNGKLYGIEENSLLNGFHFGSLYSRANKTQDNTTHDLPFLAGLVFTQNVEPFALRSVKERVCSVEFFPHDTTADSKQGIIELRNIKPAQLAFIGHTVLTNRKFFEEQFLKKMNSFLVEFAKVAPRRLAFVHAVPLTGVDLLLDLVGEGNVNRKKMAGETSVLLLKKMATATATAELADSFFDALDALRTTSRIVHGEHLIEDSTFIYVRVDECLREMKTAGYPFAMSPTVKGELERHERFVEKARKTSRGAWRGADTQRVFVFKRV